MPAGRRKKSPPRHALIYARPGKGLWKVYPRAQVLLANALPPLSPGKHRVVAREHHRGAVVGGLPQCPPQPLQLLALAGGADLGGDGAPGAGEARAIGVPRARPRPNAVRIHHGAGINGHQRHALARVANGEPQRKVHVRSIPPRIPHLPIGMGGALPPVDLGGKKAHTVCQEGGCGVVEV